VLDSGALPMKILEEKIDRWIAAKKGGASTPAGKTERGL